MPINYTTTSSLYRKRQVDFQLAVRKKAELKNKMYSGRRERYLLSQEQREAEKRVRLLKRQAEYDARQRLCDENRQYYYNQRLLDTIVGSTTIIGLLRSHPDFTNKL